ncbi:MAG TPA: hypothetical protein VE548_00195 [Nitrososphaeraceae archaeon]|jgi:hypothetical protein|nr:hypothetical protein [Nitrososphaeraceae archaeon]
MDARILIVGIAIGLVLSGGTAVFAQSNISGNNTDIGSAEELAKLTSNNSLTNLSSMTTFNDTGTNQTGNQSSAGNSSSASTPGQPGYTPPG